MGLHSCKYPDRPCAQRGCFGYENACPLSDLSECDKAFGLDYETLMRKGTQRIIMQKFTEEETHA
jgi:hypothetical protein